MDDLISPPPIIISFLLKFKHESRTTFASTIGLSPSFVHSSNVIFIQKYTNLGNRDLTFKLKVFKLALFQPRAENKKDVERWKYFSTVDTGQQKQIGIQRRNTHLFLEKFNRIFYYYLPKFQLAVDFIVECRVSISFLLLQVQDAT